MNSQKMSDEIGNLLDAYEKKEANCETLLSVIEKRIRKLRHEKDIEGIKKLRKEQSVLFAQIQAYVQARSDIDSLLDYV